MNSLIRKFSFRNKLSKSGGDERKISAAIKKSSSALLRLLPPEVINTIIDELSFFEQLRLSRLSKSVKAHLDKKWRMIKKLEIRKQNIDEATSSSSDHQWDRHSKAYVAIRLTDDTAFMVIDDQWTGGDITVLLSMMHVFHDWVETVYMDAPIAELIVVSLSDLTLERWYTFQCLMKAFNNFDQDLHLDSPFIADRPTYWPCVRELTIFTKASQANHLARVLDYGVKSAYVVDRKTMDKLRIVFADMKAMNNKIVNKHIYHFRCWAGSLGWDHRYETQFLGGNNNSTTV